MASCKMDITYFPYGDKSCFLEVCSKASKAIFSTIFLFFKRLYCNELFASILFVDLELELQKICV